MPKPQKFLTALFALSLLAFLIYLFKHKIHKLSRSQILKIAKNLHQQMQSTLISISKYVQQNQSNINVKKNAQQYFHKQIQQKLNKIFAPYTQKNFYKNIKKYYQNDIEINYHLTQYQQQLQNALTGSLKQQIITFITPDKLLQIVTDLLQAKIQRLLQKINEKITLHQMVIRLNIQKHQQKQLRSNKLRQLGLIGRDTQLAKIFQFLVAMYCKNDHNFNKKYQQILEQYRRKSNQFIDMFCAFPRSPSSLINSAQQ